MRNSETKLEVLFYDASYKHQERLKQGYLLSDFSGLNQLLGKGFEAGLFHLVYGTPHITNSLLLSLAVAAHLPLPSGIASSVVFIDNDNIFNPYTLIRLALAVKLNPTTVLSRIFVARAFIWNHLGEIVDNLKALLETQKARVVLISGLTTLFEGEFERKRHQMLLIIANKLRTLAIDENIVILASGRLAQGSAYKPAGGKIISHAPQVLIRALAQGPRITFDLLKHPSRPASQVVHWVSQPKRVPNVPPLEQFLEGA
ncbi:MAG: hypothetical protein EU536_00990 [Promethearchaeota archaeon]|nr:MAG: hypothetical protein EU536_00990 [Candidatus Lokiarchaeota archaeon]